ncbi:uncharacterized protein LOC143035181 isoform X2 [Oratosquilla oratoria]|uniref:uncharacterized protein LOC143035181 isoform X2 n=1 Tax=Oratosquilla oratoria TaxID=337810 RepID=UPI003F762768
MEPPSSPHFTPLHKGRSFICYRDVNKAIEKHRELYGVRLVLKKAVKLENYCLTVEQMRDLNFRLKYGELEYHCSLDNGRPGRPGNTERCPRLIHLRLSPDARTLVVHETHVHELLPKSPPPQVQTQKSPTSTSPFQTFVMAQRLKPKSVVFEYFSPSCDGKYFVCQCQVTKGDDEEEICGANINFYSSDGKSAPTRASNLKRHLQRHHPKVLKIVTKRDRENKKDNVAHVPGPSGPNFSSQTDDTKDFVSEEVKVLMTADKFKGCIIEMVVKNDIPLGLFSTPAFVSLNGEMAHKLGVPLERNSIQNLVLTEAKKQKDALKEFLCGRFIFLKIDACTCQKMNYFAVNIQCVNDKKEVVTHTLAVRNTEAHLTSNCLQKLLLNVMEDFEICKEQVLSVVIDNATNIISTLEKIKKNEVLVDFDENQETHDTVSDSGDTGLEECVEAALRQSRFPLMHCGVHILQLAIHDGLRQPHVANLIGRLKNFVAAARTSKLDTVLKQHAEKGTILDQATQWGRVYRMIQHILEIRPFLSDIDSPDVMMIEDQWEQVKELEGLLRHLYSVAENLQATDLTPGLFYKEWKNLFSYLSCTGSIIADGIMKSMLCRESTVLDNDILLAAVYVDPMYRVTLKEDEQVRAKAALFEVAIQLKGLHIDEASTKAQAPVISSSNSDDRELMIDKDSENQEWSKRHKLDTEGEKALVLTKFKLDFSNALREVEKIQCDPKLTVKDAITQYPEIVQDAAQIVTGLPLTQVSVERLFSAIQRIRSDVKAAVKGDLSEAILFLRTNTFGSGLMQLLKT